MTKAFMKRSKTLGAGTAQTTEIRHDTVMVGAGEVQNHDGTYAMDTIPANLAHHGLRSNQFKSHRLVTAADVWMDLLAFRPSVPFRSFRRMRNAATGVVNPSTAILDLNNGTGTAAANDVCIINFVHVGDLNDNLIEVDLWLRRTAVGGSGNSTLRLALANVTAVANAVTGAFNALGAAAHNAVPLALDVPNYFTAALAYAEVRCDAVAAGGNGMPIAFPLQYNAAAVQAAPLVPGQVYALILYLNQANVADTDTFEVFGSETAIQDPTSECYFGAAGWNGVIAADATCLSPWMILSKTGEAVINQIHIYADNGHDLGDSQLMSLAVVPDADGVCDNIPAGGVQWKRELLHNLQLADIEGHNLVFEGKAVVPRRYFLKAEGVCDYTGEIIVEINYWTNPEGTLTTSLLNA
jgi:hypothetical protein